SVYFDGTQMMSVTDIEATPYGSGSVSADMWTDATGYTMSVDDVVVTKLANDDSFTATQDTLLTVAAPGVLGNDTEVYGSALTATVVTGPTNGMLNLNANGGFTYTPASAY